MEECGRPEGHQASGRYPLKRVVRSSDIDLQYAVPPLARRRSRVVAESAGSSAAEDSRRLPSTVRPSRAPVRQRRQVPALTFSHFGPQLVAKDAELISRFRLNRRDLDAFYTDLLDVPAPSLGASPCSGCRKGAPGRPCVWWRRRRGSSTS